jgi:hypothetical protein
MKQEKTKQKTQEGKFIVLAKGFTTSGASNDHTS